MLNEFRSTFITWDKATSRIYSPITANASDENGRKLVVQIVNSGQVEDLTGTSLHLYWVTTDKRHYGLDVFKAVDLKKGMFELSYTTGMLSNRGVLKANLVLIDTVGRVVSDRFTITVKEGIDNDAIQSENSFTSLTKALIDISNLEQNYAPRLNDLTAQLQQTEQELSSQLAQKASYDEARLKTVKLELEDMSETTLGAMSGNATFNLLSIPQEDSVTSTKVKNGEITVPKIEGSTLVKSANLFDKTKATTGYYINNIGEVVAQSILGFSDYIRVKPNTQYIFFNEGAESGSFNAHRGSWYDENKVRIEAITGDNNPICVTNASPSNARYVRFNITLSKIDQYMWVEGTTYPSQYVPFRYESEIQWLKLKKAQVDKSTRWYDKKANFLGTSLTNGVGATSEEKKFREIVKSRLGLAVARNYGVSGTLITQEDGKTNSFVERYPNMDNDADLIIVEGPTNDYFNGKGLLGAENSTNTYEFYGALNMLIQGLKAKYPGKEIVFVTTHNMHFNGKSSDELNVYSGATLKDYRDAMLKRCEYHGIPVLDLFSTSGIDCAHTVSDRTTYTTDGVHLNDFGNVRYADRYVGFLMKI